MLQPEFSTKQDARSSTFISYSRKDKIFAGNLSEVLKTRGLTTWLDSKDIPFSGAWEQELYSAIEKTDALIFIISPDSVASPNCAKEINHAVKFNKRIVPILYRHVAPEIISPEIAKFQFIDFTDATNFNSDVDSLIQTLETDLLYVQSHTRLLTRGLEWERKEYDGSFVLRGSDLQNAEQWLVQASANKKPRPTQLQTQYILASRRAATRRQRIVIGSITLGLVVAIILASLYWGQRNVAIDQARIALARQLAAQAQLIIDQRPNQLPRGTLLAIESALRFEQPSLEADQALRQSLALLPRSVAFIPHNTQLETVSFSNDSRYLITASDNKTARVWEVSTGREIADLSPNAPLSSITFCPKGECVAAIRDNDNTAIVWRILDTKEVGTIKNINKPNALAVAEVSGKTYVALTVDDRTVKIWEIGTNKEVASMIHTDKVESIAFSWSGRWLATRSENRVYMWETLTWRQIAAVIWDRVIETMTFSPNEDSFATTATDTVQVWAIPGLKPKTSVKHGNFIKSLAFSSDGKYLATASVVRTFSDTNARVWRTIDGVEVARLPMDGQLSAVSFSADGKYLATASGGSYPSDNTARIWDWANGREMARIAHDDGVVAIAFSPDGKYFATGSWDRHAGIWRADSDEIPSLNNPGRLVSVVFSNDRKYIALTSRLYESGGDSVCVWETATGSKSDCFSDLGLVIAVAFDPANQNISVAQGGTGDLQVIQIRSGEASFQDGNYSDVRLTVFSPGQKYRAVLSDAIYIQPQQNGRRAVRIVADKPISTITFSPNELMVSAGTMDGNIRVWDVLTGRQRASMTQQGDVEAIAFSPTVKYLAAASWDSASNQIDISVWDAVRFSRITQFPGNERVLDLAFSPDERYLVIASQDHTARIWDLVTHKEVGRARFNLPVRRIVFGFDSKHLIAVVGDGTSTEIAVRPFLWQSSDLLSEACSRLTRNLSVEEWRDYLGTETRRKTCQNLP